MKLGKFIQDKDGNFHGSIRAYSIAETPVILSPQTSSDGKPYYEIIADPMKNAFDGGAAFPKKKGELEYLSVSLDSPAFPAPVNAGLFQDKANPEIYNLVWDRAAQKPALTADATQKQEAQADAQPAKKSAFFHRKPSLALKQ